MRFGGLFANNVLASDRQMHYKFLSFGELNFVYFCLKNGVVMMHEKMSQEVMQQCSAIALCLFLMHKSSEENGWDGDDTVRMCLSHRVCRQSKHTPFHQRN
ncbi:unnamed protein product [Anisakis simplex]|uniref:Uncharacterized protein n=1 Tax=Anisakis simplex TaxID=6269 RepID=A0A3P6QM21_ANISI|nr:unnamed protein product [Anisakis simplex]